MFFGMTQRSPAHRSLRLAAALVAALAVAAPLPLVAAPVPATHHRKPPTLAELQSRAKQLAIEAGAARKAADRAAIATARARANLRLAESNLDAVRNTAGAHAAQLQLPASQQSNAVIAAEAQLRQAQMAAQQEQFTASVPDFSQPPQGASGIKPLLGSVNQTALQQAQAAVAAAQQRLAAAQQAAAMNSQAAALANNFDSVGIAIAAQSVATARQLADSAARAARAAELNAETLAEDAAQARAAVVAATAKQK
jgi:predicted DNA binding CopG/RHH family protein